VNMWIPKNPEQLMVLTPMESAAVSEMEIEIQRFWMENELPKKSAAIVSFQGA